MIRSPILTPATPSSVQACLLLLQVSPVPRPKMTPNSTREVPSPVPAGALGLSLALASLIVAANLLLALGIAGDRRLRSPPAGCFFLSLLLAGLLTGLALPALGQGPKWHLEGEERGPWRTRAPGASAALPVRSVACDDVLGGGVRAGRASGGRGLLPEEAAPERHPVPGTWVPRARSHEWRSPCDCPWDHLCW